MKEQVKTSIIDTLSYFDVFNYPPTINQISLFLHFNKANKKLIKECLDEIPIVDHKYGYYFFSGNENNAVKRKIHEEENARKIKLARRYSFFISKIPGVKLVALTGSLAIESSVQNDDIDFLIVTRKNTLWIIRPVIAFTTKILGKKRKYNDAKTKDKFCLNMFVDERELEFLDKNLYVAHEIAQMKILNSKNKIPEMINRENLWIREFLPNVSIRRKIADKRRGFQNSHILEKIIRSINFMLFFVQYIYMNNKITKEKISLRKAFFHPNDNSMFVLGEYKKRRKKYLDLNASTKHSDRPEQMNNSYKRMKLYN